MDEFARLSVTCGYQPNCGLNASRGKPRGIVPCKESFLLDALAGPVQSNAAYRLGERAAVSRWENGFESEFSLDRGSEVLYMLTRFTGDSQRGLVARQRHRNLKLTRT